MYFYLCVYMYKHEIEIFQRDVLPFFNHLLILKDWFELLSNVLNLLAKEECYLH